ncbi:MAG: hypothetical protein H8E62_03380, partial [Planctomycetes bacterium]|nr:hypothetical protein [Planctomycetota bacterium]
AVAATEEDMRLLGVKIQNVRAIDKRALDLKEILKQHELRRREEGYPEYPLESELKAIETLTGFGLSPEHAYAIGSNIFNDDRKMNLLGAIGPTYKAVEDWDITKEEIADRGNTNIHYHNEVIYNRPEKPATTRTGDLN